MGQLLSDRTRAALLSVLAADDAYAAAADATPLTALNAIRTLIGELEADPATLTCVRQAIDAGVSWSQIAEAASIQPAAAKWRWQGTDAEIEARHAAGRKRSARQSSVPTDLPGRSVAEAATLLGVSAQAIYLRITRGQLSARTVTLDDGRSYKRVFLEEE